MALSAADRKAFSLKIVTADQEVAVYTQAKAQLAAEVAKLQALDDANKNLFDPVNAQTNQYQLEYTALDGLTRSTFSETDIQNSAKVLLGNYFYPNNVQVTVPSLVASNNVWTKPKPFALTYAIGKNYTEQQPLITNNETTLINTIKAYIATSLGMPAIETATGLITQATGSCSIGIYTTQSDCTAHSGTWTPGPNILVTSTAATTLKNNLVTAINSLKTLLQTEASNIVTDDKDSTFQGQNNTAIDNINNTILPALNTWLAYVDFNSTGVTGANYNSFNASTLAPTKLSVTQITALNTALTNRQTFITTRLSQLATVVGTISQDLNDGTVTSSGLYGKRYNLLLLRLDLLNGSLSKLFGLKNGSSAQDSIISSVKTNKATYLSVVPTSLLVAPGNNTNSIQVADPSLFSVGDTVFIMAEGQDELQRAIKSKNGNTLELNDLVPAKYKTTNQLRVYKDNT